MKRKRESSISSSSSVASSSDSSSSVNPDILKERRPELFNTVEELFRQVTDDIVIPHSEGSRSGQKMSSSGQKRSSSQISAGLGENFQLAMNFLRNHNHITAEESFTAFEHLLESNAGKVAAFCQMDKSDQILYVKQLHEKLSAK